MLHADSASFEVADGPTRLARWLARVDSHWPGGRRRLGGMARARALEAGLILLLLTRGRDVTGHKGSESALTTISVEPEAPPAPEPAKPKPPAPSPRPTTRTVQLPRAQPPRALPFPVAPPIPVPSPAAVLPLSKNDMAKADIGAIKAVVRPGSPGPIGPADSGSPGDSQRIQGASGPHGEPLYRAQWYREPTDQELAGYLSTVDGPGWALINCKTVPDFRVEDCVLVDEYPDNAGMGRAVLAAAWQFRVRPPRVGGRSLVGEWVRIRIDYTIRQRKTPAG
ncbi:MAG: hypothetical protein ACTHK5_08505 [Tsuneonella sp.]